MPDFGYAEYQAQKLKKLTEYLERKAFEREMYKWGKWCVKEWERSGHPSMTVEYRASHGGGGGVLGHRILILEWPSDVLATHGRVLRLQEVEQDVVGLKYAICVKDDGNLWKREEWCLVYGISEDNFRQILSRAKKKIQGLPAD